MRFVVNIVKDAASSTVGIPLLWGPLSPETVSSLARDPVTAMSIVLK